MNAIFSLLGKFGGGVGLVLNQFLVVYNVLKSFPIFWRVVQNIDQVKVIFDDGKKLLSMVIEKREVSHEAIALSLDIVKRSFQSGIIDLDNLDEEKFLIALGELEETIYKSGLGKGKK